MTRIWALAALAAGIWLLSVHGPARPVALGLDAPAAQFSAARADAVLGRILGPEVPHPLGSAADAALQARLLKQLAALGVTARTQTVMSCYGEPRWNVLPCGTVTNIVAQILPGNGKTVLLMAHSDSVAAGPGAADDGSGVAAVLEIIRALKVRGGNGHPVTALFTDGEEPGLLGAAAWLRDPAARAGIGAVINLDVRGNRGRSFLFQTSAGDARLMDLYAAHAADYAASSIGVEIYKYMPNDTDLTPMLAAGVAGVNFAFFDNVAAYHTPLDRRAAIDPQSLQQQGDNALAMADALRQADPQSPWGGDAVYLDVLGRWLPRLSVAWALPLSLATFVMIALAGFFTPRGRRELPRPLLGFLMPPLLLAGAAGMGFVLHALAVWISGQSDPSFAHPVWLRLSLGLGVWTVALLTARGAGAIACWLWLSAGAIACAVWLPGASPYFLFPALVAAPLLLVTVRGGRGAAVFIAALVSLLLWFSLTVTGEALMGLALHEMFTATVALGLVALLPLLRAKKGWAPSVLASLGAALLLAVVAGLQPANSIAAPQRLNLRYVEAAGKAWWLADPVAHLPQSLRAAANFSATPQHAPEWGYAAAAGAARFAAPAAAVSRIGNDVTLILNAPGDSVLLKVPREAQLQSLTIGGVTTPAPQQDVAIICHTPDCGHAVMTLHVGTAMPFAILLQSARRGLPAQGARLVAARPSDAVPSQGGDVTHLLARITIPGG